MDLRAVLVELDEALREVGIDHALIGGLALAAHGAGRATVDLHLLAEGARADDVDRIPRERGYDPLHRRLHDMADVEHLLETAAVDLERVREYFRLFDREKELDALLARRGGS